MQPRKMNEMEPLDIKNHLTENAVCCPQILNANTSACPICSNNLCTKKLIILAGSQILTCPSCSRKLRLRKAKIKVKIAL